MAPRGTRWRRRGATLIEAMIALAALGAGTAGIVSLLSYLSQSNRRLAFQGRSIDVAGEFAALVRDATCDVLPTGTTLIAPQADPGLLVTTWQTAPVSGSSLRLVGRIAGIPPVDVSYTAAPEPGGVRTMGPPSIDITLRVREVTGDPAKDNPAVTTGYWIRDFSLKKVCNQRLDVVGRGEFY